VRPSVERRRRPRAGPLLRLYYKAKYSLFARERHPRDGRRGLLVLQIDALAYADLRRAIRLGFCPTIRRLLTHEDFRLRRWFCGLPAATPYCQAGIFYGENTGIPAFRFYDKRERRVITCNAPEGVQYIRDRIRAPGALAGGSSYVNLLDGDAATVAFTVATRERMSVYRRLGGTRMLLLMALHPIRIARMVLQAAVEWLREEWERAWGELSGRVTHTEGIFPFVRILSNVVVRELQTMAIVLDLYLGVPVIYSTYMQYDELAHHFGPTSRQALADLKRTDARITEVVRMMRNAAGRGYDLVMLSDHGMTPSVSYRVRFQETLGTTVAKLLSTLTNPLLSVASYAEDSEYADVGPQVLHAAAQVASSDRLLRLRDWVRRHYGLRELLVPEKYKIDARNDVVVTYSSCLAELYFADDDRALEYDDIHGDPRRSGLYAALLAHPGIGVIATRKDGAIHLASRTGRAMLDRGTLTVIAGDDPLASYGSDALGIRAVESLVRQPNGGDLVLFGAYDGYEIISFDDQVGAHGSIGGDQVFPFLITPASLGVDETTAIEDARDIHRVIMTRYSAAP
jgi:Type I phosphodiesterase / nucleotide pyrophosphatase